MNREILFRGFHKCENGAKTICLNGEEIKGNWVYGNHIYDNTTDKHYIDLSISEDETDSNKLYIYAVEVIPETVGQYVGLDDKNGKKIFEDDVIKSHYANAPKDIHIEKVVFYKGKFMAFEEIDDCGHWTSLYDGISRLVTDKSIYMDDMEVIGTIFDKEVNENV